jgi:hypothetical protein
MEASQHSLLAACFTLHSINATLAMVPQRGAGLWISYEVCTLFVVRHVEEWLGAGVSGTPAASILGEEYYP